MRAHHVHYVPPVATEPDLFAPPAQPVDTSLAAAGSVVMYDRIAKYPQPPLRNPGP